MGFENFEIHDSKLTTQTNSIRIVLDSGKDMDIHAGCGHLNLPYCAICGSSKIGQYFQVDLRQDYTIIGVATQGFEALIHYFVRSYNLTHSRDGQIWSLFPVSINLTFLKSKVIMIAMIILTVILVLIRTTTKIIIIALKTKFQIFEMIYVRT